MQENKVRVVFEAVLDNFQKNVKSAAKATLEIGDAGEKASKKVNFDDSSRSVNTLEGNLKKLQNTLKTLAVGYMGKKLLDAGKENLMYFAEYQKGLAQTFTLLPDITKQGMEQMSDDVKQFAKDMKVLPEEILPALYQAISASVPEDEVFGFLETARKSSVGGVTEMETAVDVLSSIVNAYGDDVIDATRASDLMFTAMKKGKTTFGEMASNMYSVLPIAKALEVPFENVTAAISTMTAMGTPTAQATTQIGRMFLEFSKDGTRASEIFIKATGRTFKQFIAEGNNAQDALKVMEEVAKKAGLEINNLFNSAEAGNAALALTGKGTQKFTEDLEAMADSAGATEEAYEKMSGTISFMLDGIKAKISVFKIEIAERYFPEIEDAIKKVDETFDRLEQNGSLDRLAQSIGGIISTIILEFDKWLNNIDSVIDKINSLAYFIENNLSGAIGVVKALTVAFIAFKTAAAISAVIEAVAGAIALLTGAQWALNAAMNANPIGIIITLIGLLILGIIKLAGGIEGLKDKGILAFHYLKLGFLLFTEKVVWGVNQILEALDWLLGWIPGLGTAFKTAARVSGEALSGLRGEIDKTIDKIDELNNKKAEPKPFDPSDLDFPGIEPGPSSPWSPETNPPSTPKPTPNYKPISAGTSSKPKTIHDRIRGIEDKYSPDIDLHESRQKLAESRGDTVTAKTSRTSIIEALRKQAGDLLSLEKSSTGQDIKIVEAARNKILLKIEDLLKGINEGVSKMVGDFNIPSELRALTEYQYKVEKSDNKFTKRMIYSPNVDMYLTISDTEGKGISQIKQEIEGFTNAIFGDKNNLVTSFMQDVTRN